MTSSGGPIRVLLADDQPLIREGFRSILGRADDIVVIGDAADGVVAVELARRHRPDVVVMDIRMPRLDGIAATAQITRDVTLASTRVVVVTTYELDSNVFDALRAGASGFLLKDLEPDELRRAVRVAAAGDALLAPSITRRLIGHFAASPPESTSQTIPGVRADPARAPVNDAARIGDAVLSSRLAALTDREREVVSLVGAGLSNAEIADRLFISPTTAKTHVSHAMIKASARDRAQLVVFAYETGLVRGL
jgi:DNA-binding NarL/FixJ family response regulator